MTFNIRICVYYSLSLMVVFISTGLQRSFLFAMTNADIKSIVNRTDWYDPGDGGKQCSNKPVATASSSVVSFAQNVQDKIKSDKVVEKASSLRERYEFGAKSVGIPWQILAAIHYREGGQGANSSIADGSRLADGITVDGVKKSSDPNEDAKLAAEHLRDLAKSVYGVTVSENPSEDDLIKSFVAYNRGFLYKKNGTDPSRSPYAMNGYDTQHSYPMNWVGGASDPGSSTTGGGADRNLGAMVIYKALQGVSSGNADCNGQSGPFVFPLQTTQSEIKKYGWCYKSTNNCHHDYNSADLMIPAGAIVLSATSGTVKSANLSSSFGQNVTIKGDDGLVYYYNHMTPNSLSVGVGQKVQPGTKIGEVASVNSYPNVNADHLHFSIVKGLDSFPSCAGASCKPYSGNLQNVQPILIEAMKGLPE